MKRYWTLTVLALCLPFQGIHGTPTFEMELLWKQATSEFGVFSTLELLGSSRQLACFKTETTKGYEVYDEIYVTDGTVNGTQMIQTFNDNIGEPITAYRGSLYFGAPPSPESHEKALWTSDGTKEGTRLFKEDVQHPEDFFVFHDRLYFTAMHPKNGTELWVSDGTPEGTTLFQDISPGRDSDPRCRVVNEEKFVCTADDGNGAVNLWSSSGVGNDTNFLATLAASDPEDTFGSFTSYGFIVSGGQVFPRIQRDDNPMQFWVTNGTSEGTIRLSSNSSNAHFRPIAHPNMTSSTLLLRLDNRELMLSSYSSTGYTYEPFSREIWLCSVSLGFISNELVLLCGVNRTTHERGLYAFDGKTSGVHLVKDLPNAYPYDSIDINNLSEPYSLVDPDFMFAEQHIDGSVPLVLFNLERGFLELWSSDGTQSGTSYVRDLGDERNPRKHPDDQITVKGGPYCLPLAAIAEQFFLYGISDIEQNRTEWWVTYRLQDADGTQMIGTHPQSWGITASPIKSLNDREHLFMFNIFEGTDAEDDYRTSAELWKFTAESLPSPNDASSSDTNTSSSRRLVVPLYIWVVAITSLYLTHNKYID